MSIPAAVWVVGMLVAVAGSSSFAQTDPGAGGRRLADGVLKIIPSELNARDTYSLPGVMPGLEGVAAYESPLRSSKETLHGMSRRVVFFRDVWQYEFAFTGLRQVKLNIPTVDGRPSQNVFYMVYRVRNTGDSLSFEDVKKDPGFNYVTKDLRKNQSVVERKFLPELALEGAVYNDKTKRYSRVSYQDEVAPEILAAIQNIEDPNTPLFDAVQLSNSPLAAIPAAENKGVWGVAIWTDVDPKLDFISVYVSGFTNAFRIVRTDSGIAKLKRKTLQLNFWRPGDAINQSEDEIQYGIPLVSDPVQQVLITKQYNLPGPLMRVYEDNREISRMVLQAEFDARVNLKDFSSPLIPILDKGTLPEIAKDAMLQAGVNVDGSEAIQVVTAGKKWSFETGGKTYFISLEFQFWQPNLQRESIEFIKSLDSFWIYR